MSSEPMAMNSQRLINELQSSGLRLLDPASDMSRRHGGAGPSDHQTLIVQGISVVVPVHTADAVDSPYTAVAPDAYGGSVVEHHGTPVGLVQFPREPRFYSLQTADGVPYRQIARLHGTDVMVSTVQQTCIRYESPRTTCRFCAIGQSLDAGRTLARKTPAQLAEVAAAAVELDGIRHMVMTTGTPNRTDRGAALLAESAAAVKAAVDLPVQVQCEPPDDHVWFGRLRDAGVDTLGMHLEAVTTSVRQRIMPGKAEVPVEQYLEAFAAAVPVFGRGQVSSYILAGLGDEADDILAMCRTMIELGVYPFVVPFVPIAGTPLENQPAPSAAFMHRVLEPLGAMLGDAGMTSRTIKAGCGRCGACSSLSTYERCSRPVADAVPA